MFGIQHRDGSWWVDGARDQHGPRWSMWSLNARIARRFVCADDAFKTAYLECTTSPDDYQAVPLPTGALAVSS